MKYLPARFLYAILCLLLISWAAFAQAPAQYPGKAAKALPQHPGASGVIQVLPQHPAMGWGQCSCGFGQCPCGGGKSCGCGMGSFSASGVVTYQQVPIYGPFGRFRGYRTEAVQPQPLSQPLTPPAPAGYTVPFQQFQSQQLQQQSCPPGLS